MEKLELEQVTSYNAKGITTRHRVHKVDEVAPSPSQRQAIENKATIVIPANDAGVTSPVQMLRPWETLTLFGFYPEQRSGYAIERKIEMDESDTKRDCHHSP